MSTSSRKWTQGLHFSSLFRQPPQDSQQHQAQVLAYVKLFAQFTSEEFPDDIAELVRSHYPNCKSCLLDDVLATFVLHHPEHGHAFIHPLLSCIIDGTLTYDRATPPFSSFISLFSPSSQNDFSEQWALACGEILRVLTHYNRPVYKTETILNKETERCVSGSSASTSNCEPNQSSSPAEDSDKKPLRLLTPWITDILLAAPLGIRSDYFRWCGGVMGKYAAAGELKPPTTAGLRGPGKHPQLMPSTPRWAVANGAGVILSVCDDEVNRYETAHLTAAAVPALLLPPPTTALDEHLVAGLPPLEPYARLFHRYYAIASPSATQRLLLGLLEAPPSWAPDALDAAVQLVELLRAAEDYATNMRLPKTWIHLHFLRAIGTALSMRAGIVADAAAALLFRILSQPALLFPPRHAQCLDHQRDIQNSFVSSNNDVKIESTAYQENIEATAQGVASLMCTHGPEVEWRICTLWEAAYGLLPLSSSAVDLPEIVVASPLQPPILSWSLFHPLLRVLEYLPRGSPSESSLIKIFTVTVEEVLKRTFPMLNSIENAGLIETFHGSFRSTSKNLAATELRAMVHSLFTETCPSMDVASRLLFVLLTVCLSHDAAQQYGRKEKVERSIVLAAKEQQVVNGKQKVDEDIKNRDRGAVAAFDSYVLAALCALACEVQLLALPSRVRKFTQIAHATCSGKTVKTAKLGKEAQSGINSAASHIRRLLGILESLLSLKPSSVGLCPRNCSSSEIVASAVVAAHVSNLLVCSKASKQALLILKRCKWDSDVCAKASSVLALIDANGKAVAAVSEKSRHIKHHLEEREALSRDACSYERNYAASKSGCVSEENARKSSTMQTDSKKLKWENSSKIESLEKEDCVSGKTIASLPMNAVEVATLLAMERHDAANGNVEYLVKFVLKEKQNLCIAAVPLLWQRLITAPDMEMSVESTSAEQGWRQLVKALCNIVLASPVKAAAAIVLQVERDLQPWVVKDDTEGQRMWRVNQRIASLFAEILRLHNVPAAWIVLLDASELLLRATDGILVDGEACATPQLELLQATAVAARLSISWGSAGNILGERLWNLLKSRLGPIVQCLSHCSAHVRALSRAVLWDSLHTESLSIMYDNKQVDKEPGSKDLCATEHMTFQGWRNDVEECLTWEACRIKEQGMSIVLLASAANALGCSITF